MYKKVKERVFGLKTKIFTLMATKQYKQYRHGACLVWKKIIMVKPNINIDFIKLKSSELTNLITILSLTSNSPYKIFKMAGNGPSTMYFKSGCKLDSVSHL